MRVLLVSVLLAGVSAFAPPLSRVAGVSTRASLQMADAPAPAAKKEKEEPVRVPGEGDPFSAAAKAAAPEPARQPRAISDATVVDRIQASNYIDNEDEPWHATARGTNVLGMILP